MIHRTAIVARLAANYLSGLCERHLQCYLRRHQQQICRLIALHWHCVGRMFCIYWSVVGSQSITKKANQNTLNTGMGIWISHLPVVH